MSQCDDKFSNLKAQNVNGLSSAIKGEAAVLPIAATGTPISIPQLLVQLSNVQRDEKRVGQALVGLPGIAFCYLSAGDPPGAAKVNAMLNLLISVGSQLQTAEHFIQVVIALSIAGGPLVVAGPIASAVTALQIAAEAAQQAADI